MEAKILHIVSFDVPYPPDYGGVMDVFYKIRALHEAGVRIKLHSFQYGRRAAAELEKYCSEIHYYPRKKIYTGIVSRVPYIVGSRINPELLERLASDGHPVLFEGLHTCAYLDHPILKSKLKAVRMHNVEWQYYRGLFDHSTETLKTIYYAVESKRLQRYESVLVHADHIFAISKTETEYLESRYPQTSLLFPFHGVSGESAGAGTGKFMLYHGNLSVPENEEAVNWLIQHLETDEDFPMIIAGKKPGQTLKNSINGKSGFRLIENPSAGEMENLIKEAQLHILPAFQSTGVKLKLLRSLFSGRFVLSNPMMLEGTGLEDLCLIFKRPSELNALIKEYQNALYSPDLFSRRAELLKNFDDRKGAEQIIRTLFP
jgi:hypothetical protein